MDLKRPKARNAGYGKPKKNSEKGLVLQALQEMIFTPRKRNRSQSQVNILFARAIAILLENQVPRKL